MRLLVRLFFALVCFVAGFALTVGFARSYLAVTGEEVRATYLWLTGPVITAFIGWQYGGQVDVDGLLARMGRRQRMMLGCSALWVLVCAVAFSIFDLFGKYRWDTTEWVKFATIAGGPIIVAILLGRVSRWANEARS